MKIKRMKKIILSIPLLLFALLANAQKNTYNINYGSNHEYSASGGSDFGFGLSFTVDQFTRTVDYHNSIPNQPLSNLVYLEGTKEINLFGYLNKDSLSFYRYNIVENDSNQIVSDAVPQVTKIKTSYRNRVDVDLGKFNVENKKITINLYKINKRSEIATIIIYNKIIQPASISMINLNIHGKKGGYVEFKSKKDAAVLSVNEATKNLMIVIKSTDLDFVYNVYLKDKSTGKIVFRSNNWLYG